MDGNNRWSKINNKDKYFAYKKGAKKLITISDYIFKNYKVNNISAFALSRDNLNRSTKFIQNIFNVLNDILDIYPTLEKNLFKIKFIGDLNFLSADIKKKIINLENKNISIKKTLFIFLNYSGQDEIINLTKKNLLSDNLSKEFINNKFQPMNIPFPDILIRTGGFQRISNFMLFQIAFTELFFLKKLWPDIFKSDIDKIINKYNSIERKFGY